MKVIDTFRSYSKVELTREGVRDLSTFVVVCYGSLPSRADIGAALIDFFMVSRSTHLCSAPTLSHNTSHGIKIERLTSVIFSLNSSLNTVRSCVQSIIHSYKNRRIFLIEQFQCELSSVAIDGERN